MSGGMNTDVDKVGESLLRLTLLALLIMGLLKVLAPEFTHLRDELGLGVVSAQVVHKGEQRTGGHGHCGESSPATQKPDPARRRRVNPRRARKKISL